MANGKQPKTDREWLIQIDSKIEGLCKEIKQERTDTINIFNRLRSVELEAEKRTGCCKVHISETNALAEKLDAIPNVNKAIKLWGALFVLMQIIIGTMLAWKG